MLDPDIGVRFVFRGSTVSLTRYTCSKRDPSLGREECQTGHVVAFPVEGAFVWHRQGRHSVVDPNQAVFFSDGECYRTSHPHGCGDHGVAIVVEEAALREILATVGFSDSDRERSLFPAEVATVDPCAALIRHSIFQALDLDDQFSALHIEEMSLMLIARLVGRPLRGEYDSVRRLSTKTAHRRLVDDVRGFLTSHFIEPLALADVAMAVHSSPFHLARVFRAISGYSVYQYRQALRLNRALSRIEAGEACISTLAYDLGFSSHSHLATAFKQRFGMSPTEARHGPSIQLLRQMSTDLKASPFEAR